VLDAEGDNSDVWLSHNLCHTAYVRRNVTLTVEDDLLREARKVAVDRRTSVNQLVREYLTGLVREAGGQQAALARMDEVFRTTRVEVGGRSWKREELHER
jgi:hypothetical protein